MHVPAGTDRHVENHYVTTSSTQHTQAPSPLLQPAPFTRTTHHPVRVTQPSLCVSLVSGGVTLHFEHLIERKITHPAESNWVGGPRGAARSVQTRTDHQPHAHTHLLLVRIHLVASPVLFITTQEIVHRNAGLGGPNLENSCWGGVVFSREII